MWHGFLFIVSTGLFLMSFSANGQILNADKFGRHTDTSKAFRGNIQLGLLLNKQEEQLLSTSGAVDLSRLINNNVLILAGSSSFIRTGGETLINGGFAHLRYRHGYVRKFTPEVFIQIQYDAIRGLRQRELAGANLRHTIFNSGRSYFYVAAGLMMEREVWDYSGVTTPGYEGRPSFVNNFWRLNSYTSFLTNISEVAEAGLVAYYQVRPDQLSSYRLSGEGKVSFKISKLLTFGVSFTAFYDNKPPVPIDKLYYTLTNQLKWSF